MDMLKKRRRIRLLHVLCLLLMIPVGVWAQHAEIRASIGYEGTIFYGRWYPLDVEITAGDKPVKGLLSVDVHMNYESMDRYQLSVDIPQGETQAFHIPLRAATAQRSFQIRLSQSEDEPLVTSVTARQAADPEALVIGVLGENEALIQALCAIDRRNVHGQRETVCAVQLDENNAAIDRRELAAFDAIVMDGFDVSHLSELQQQLLYTYEKSGGIWIRDIQTMENTEDEGAYSARSRAEAIMTEIASIQDENGYAGRMALGGRYGAALNEMMTVDDGSGLWILTAVLALYALMLGGGLYLRMKQMDRSKEMWLVIPAVSAVAALLVGIGGLLTGQNQPMASSVHMVYMDEEDMVYTEENVSLTAAGQEAIYVYTEHMKPIERKQSSYFHSASEEGERELRDVIHLLDAPSVLLDGQATWLVRNLMVSHDVAPNGVIEAKAWISEEGLQAVICNHTDTDIENALFLSPFGYKALDMLPAGTQVKLLLARQSDILEDEDGNQIIRESVMLPFAESEYRIINAHVYPEYAENREFKASDLNHAEQKKRNLLRNKYDMAATSWGDSFVCELIGEIPQIQCEQIYVGGKPVKRSVQCSLINKQIPLALTAEDGSYYYPPKQFKAYSAQMNENGKPELLQPYAYDYTEYAEGEIIGYKLSGVTADTVREIRVESERHRSMMKETTLEFFDHVENRWTDVGTGSRQILSLDMARRAVGAHGELFIRYKSASEVQAEHLFFPSITVEGKQAAKQEGGNAA